MTLKFVVAARNKPDILARVVMLFHRAAVEIAAIRMPAQRKRSELQITIAVDGRHPNACRMAAILEKVVDVLSVEMERSRFESRTNRKSSRGKNWIIVRPRRS